MIGDEQHLRDASRDVSPDAGPPAPKSGRRAWKTPTLTIVDLADVTMAMGFGTSDAGIFS